MLEMQTIEFEGGPYDGKRAPMRNDITTVYVPLRSRVSIAPVATIPISKIRRGVYRRDNLDDFTFQWEGDE